METLLKFVEEAVQPRRPVEDTWNQERTLDQLRSFTDEKRARVTGKGVLALEVAFPSFEEEV